MLKDINPTLALLAVLRRSGAMLARAGKFVSVLSLGEDMVEIVEVAQDHVRTVAGTDLQEVVETTIGALHPAAMMHAAEQSRRRTEAEEANQQLVALLRDAPPVPRRPPISEAVAIRLVELPDGKWGVDLYTPDGWFTYFTQDSEMQAEDVQAVLIRQRHLEQRSPVRSAPTE